MTTSEKMLKLAEKLAEKKVKEDKIKAVFNDKKKQKPLTAAERIDRIEQILGIG